MIRKRREDKNNKLELKPNMKQNKISYENLNQQYLSSFKTEKNESNILFLFFN